MCVGDGAFDKRTGVGVGVGREHGIIHMGAVEKNEEKYEEVN